MLFITLRLLAFRCLEGSPYADVCFLVHGVPLPAHRVILSARSSYFSHMFMSKWRDRPIIELKHKLVRPFVGMTLFGFMPPSRGGTWVKFS